jgi:pSer/pThr/pTyr-binding forkhead associated (FHA) protein
VERILRTADELERFALDSCDAPRARAALVTRAGAVALGERDRLLVGRSLACDVIVAGHGVSRVHAALVRRRAAWWIEDLGSRNGTWCDGERIERRRLADGDLLHLGREPAQFVLR